MRKLLWVILAVLSINTVAMAQPKWGEDSIACRNNLHIYYQHARNKSYLQAYPEWKYVFDNCPASSKNNVIYGPSIVKAKIKEAKDPAEEAELKKLLMNVYDKRLELYPDDADAVYERKGLDMMYQYPDSTQQAYALFQKALKISNEHSAAFYDAYFKAAAKLFNDKIFTIGDVFDAYNEVQEGLEYNNNVLNKEIAELQAKEETGNLTDKEAKSLSKAQRELERFDDVTSNNEKILTPIATCDRLTMFYNEESFEANKTDVVWLRRAAKMLTSEREDDNGDMVDCTDNPIFFSVAEALHKAEPSATSARSVGIIASKNGDYSKAAEYFKEAAGFELDPKKRGQDYLRIATYYQKLGRLGEAKSYALKAASQRSAWGTPYIVLATIYGQADGDCGANVFEKKAVYWAAIDKLKYAKGIDASVTNKANKLIEAYKKQLPDKSVIFQLGIKEGDKYTIGCFVNETITVAYD